MNVLIWVAVGIALLVAGYYKFIIQRKSDISITIYEDRGNIFIKHKNDYPGKFKKVSNNETGRTIRWLEIKGINRFWIIPNSKDLNQSTTGKKNLTLAWFGGNNFRVIKPKLKKFKYIKAGKSKNGEILFRKVPTETAQFEILTEDYKFIDYELDETLDQIYQKKQSLFDKLKPYYTISAIVLVAIMAMYITAKQNTTTSENNLNTGQILANAIQGVSEKNIDQNTQVSSLEKTTNSGG